MMEFKFRLNEYHESLTKCPHGLKTFTTGRPKRVGRDCMFCKFMEDVDFTNRVAKCKYEVRGRKKDKV